MSDPTQPDVLAVRSVASRRGIARHPMEPPGSFPLDVFPPDVAAYIAASADSARVPAAMVAVPFLSFAGATIGNQISVDIGNGWIEYPGLWVALIAITGAGKTPAMSWARVPLDYLQEEAWANGSGNVPWSVSFPTTPRSNRSPMISVATRAQSSSATSSTASSTP